MKDAVPHPVQLRQDLLWGDMDAFEHVNNTVYFRYFEDIRIQYFKDAGVMAYMQQHNIGPILANTQCQFRLPLKFPDSITISSRVHSMQGKRFTMDYHVHSKTHNQLAAEGSGLIIFYNYDKQHSCDIPEEIKTNINAMETLSI